MKDNVDKQKKSEPQKQLSKEFIREWMVKNSFQRKEGKAIAEILNSFVNEVSERYIELCENITVEAFVKTKISDVLKRIESNKDNFLRTNSKLLSMLVWHKMEID